MDLTPTIAPKSDQLNADDLMAGPRMVTVTEVRKGTTQQPVNVVTEEYGPGRPYKPSKSMRRVMVAAWGIDTANYPGRRMVLFRNPTIRFGEEEVGGIQIAAMSDITEPLEVKLTVSRGHRAPFVVQPIETAPVKDESGRDWLVELSQAEGDPDLIFALGKAAKQAHAAAQIMQIITTAYNDAKATPAPEAEEQK